MQVPEAEAAKKLEALLLEGLKFDGDDLEADDQFWAELKAEAARMLVKRRRDTP